MDATQEIIDFEEGAKDPGQEAQVTRKKKAIKKKAKKRQLKKKKSKKSSLKSDEKLKVLLAPSDLHILHTELKTLDKPQAEARVELYLNSTHQSYFAVGAVLALIQSKGWYADEGYLKFNEYVSAVFGIHSRKALYLIKISNKLIASEIPLDKVGHIGWSKLKEIVEVMTTDTVDYWVDLASQLTVTQLQSAIKDATAGDNVDEPKISDKTDLTSLSFKLHTDQKEVVLEALEKGKHEFGTEFKEVALENLCMGYLSGGAIAAPVKITEKTFKQHIIDSGLETSLTLVAEVFPDVEIVVQT